MSSSQNTPPGDPPILVPPPFGTTETTGEQLLPTAMSMDELLQDNAEFDAPVAVPVDSPPVAPTASIPNAPPAPVVRESGASADADYGTKNDDRRMLWVGIIIFLIGGGLAWAFLGPSAEQPPSTPEPAEPAIAENSSAAPQPDVAPRPAQQGPAEQAPVVPTELSELRALGFEKRHALLADAKGEVPVELHIGLDLVQATESEQPCRTFSDALSTIEASEDREAFAWALEEANAPTGEAPECGGLDQRLAALTERPSSGSNGARARATKSDRPRRSKKRRTPPPKTPPPTRPTPTAEPKPEAKPTSIATKLDDGELRGLGE